MFDYVPHILVYVYVFVQLYYEYTTSVLVDFSFLEPGRKRQKILVGNELTLII